MTILIEHSDTGNPEETAFSGPLTIWEWSKWLNSARIPARRVAIRSLAGTLHSLWREGYNIDEFPPVLWQVEFMDGGIRPLIPTLYLQAGTRPLVIDQLIRILAIWRHFGQNHFRSSDMLRFLKYFLEEEPVDHQRLACLLKEIDNTHVRLERRVGKTMHPDALRHA